MTNKPKLYTLMTLALAGVAYGQTSTIQGVLSNFEIVNNTGSPAHGFEIDLAGAVPADLYYTVSNARYGSPTIVPYTGGVIIRYSSTYSGSAWSQTTVSSNQISFAWQDCYLGGVNYATSGCDIFGQWLRVSTGVTPTAYWMIEDPANPGQLVRSAPVTIPTVYYAAIVAATPAVQITVPAPVPPPPPAQFSDAVWMKVYKTSLPRSVSGDELVLANTAVVPDTPAQIETNWTLLQKAPPGTQNRRGKSTHVVQAALAISDGAHVRRIEIYKYSGAYNSLTHEAVCLDQLCNAPSTGELGAQLGATNTAANAVADSLTVTKSGSGGAAASVVVGNITCSVNSCANYQANGATVNLTAVPGSGIAFGGWSGGCSGSGSCSVVINGKTTVDAQFLKSFTLSVGRSNSGTVTASPNGNDRALSCGSNCSAKFTDGTAVALTAVPPAGKTFVNWSGACTGTTPTCTLTITKDTSVTAVFSK